MYLVFLVHEFEQTASSFTLCSKRWENALFCGFWPKNSKNSRLRRKKSRFIAFLPHFTPLYPLFWTFYNPYPPPPILGTPPPRIFRCGHVWLLFTYSRSRQLRLSIHVHSGKSWGGYPKLGGGGRGCKKSKKGGKKGKNGVKTL